MNHAVLLIGWTNEGDWIIKNSWGKDWGKDGFAIISKDRNCGLNLLVDAVEFRVSEPYPNPDYCSTKKTVCGDGKLEGNEQCDDGNVLDNDGCSSNCTT